MAHKISRSDGELSQFFETKAEAREYARALLASGETGARVTTPGGRTGSLGTATPVWDGNGNQTGLLVTGSTWDED